MKKPTKKQIEKLNRIVIPMMYHLPQDDEIENYKRGNISLGVLVEKVIEVLNEKENAGKGTDKSN